MVVLKDFAIGYPGKTLRPLSIWCNRYENNILFLTILQYSNNITSTYVFYYSYIYVNIYI